MPSARAASAGFKARRGGSQAGVPGVGFAPSGRALDIAASLPTVLPRLPVRLLALDQFPAERAGFRGIGAGIPFGRAQDALQRWCWYFVKFHPTHYGRRGNRRVVRSRSVVAGSVLTA